MISDYDFESGQWMAAGRGPMRPIVVEASTEEGAKKAFIEEHARQVDEEKRFAKEYALGEIESHFSEAQFLKVFGQPEDLG